MHFPTKKDDLNLCLLINSLTIGGAERLSLAIYEAYKRKGIKVFFVCLEKNDFYKLHGNNIHYLSRHTGENESMFKKLWYLFIYARKLKRLIIKHEISVVQSHIYRANYVNVIAKLLGSPHNAQLVNHGIVSRYKKEGLTGWINLFLIKHLYRRADQVICPSTGMMRDLKKLGNFKDNINMIHNPFDVNAILALKDLPLDPSGFKFDRNQKYLVAVGRMEKVKRFQDIIIAVHKLIKNGMQINLLILGDGPEKASLKTMIDRLKMHYSVHLPGMVENPFQYISRSHILISASEYEGFSNVIVEALICGTPVIATDCESGPREILAPNTNRAKKLKSGQIEYAEFGVLVPVNDPDAMAVAVENLLADQNRWNTYAEEGKVRAKDFDMEVISQQYIEQLNSLTG